ncbi:MAG: SDR family NAD(P)-dependent oxidoreductase [Spirulinaceae cyanobacterium]
MTKTILLTGATDGIGLETAKSLVSLGHTVLLHGRNAAKLAAVENALSTGGGQVESYVADLSRITDVAALAAAVTNQHNKLDVLINNAGVFKVAKPITADGLDVRFVVNAIAPYLLMQQLMPLLGRSGRVVNVSSAAQSPVDLEALVGQVKIPQDFTAYAQSKLAITMWSRALALREGSPMIVAVNPGSMLGSKMVKQAFGTAGKDLQIGADILTRAAVSDEFASASGKYFDNDSGRFAPPHPDALDIQKCEVLIQTIEAVLLKMA